MHSSNPIGTDIWVSIQRFGLSASIAENRSNHSSRSGPLRLVALKISNRRDVSFHLDVKSPTRPCAEAGCRSGPRERVARSPAKWVGQETSNLLDGVVGLGLSARLCTYDGVVGDHRTINLESLAS
jgi:hypothetical protein